ncbi:MAG: hypothetical protein Q8N13_22680 [Acidovorax sp.]|nr:hypothetical protein [Acidovorax sp.]
MQFDFQPRRGMVGVTCSVTAETQESFELRMASGFGAPAKNSDGARRWALGNATVASVDQMVLGQTLRKVSVYQD